MDELYIEKWVRLSDIANGHLSVDGSNPRLKEEFIELAAECGWKLANDLGLQDVEVHKRWGNPATSGEVDVVGAWPDEQFKVRIFFSEPELSLPAPGLGIDDESYANFWARVEPFGRETYNFYDNFAGHNEERSVTYGKALTYLHMDLFAEVNKWKMVFRLSDVLTSDLLLKENINV